MYHTRGCVKERLPVCSGSALAVGVWPVKVESCPMLCHAQFPSPPPIPHAMQVLGVCPPPGPLSP